MHDNIHEAGYTTSEEDLSSTDLKPSIGEFTGSPREGLFIHTFQCMACSLEFALFSWWRDRHTVVNTACPECRRITQKTHWMATVSDASGLTFGQGPEVHHWSPVGPEPKLMADCSLFTGLPDEDPWEAVELLDHDRLPDNDCGREGGEHGKQ